MRPCLKRKITNKAHKKTDHLSTALPKGTALLSTQRTSTHWLYDPSVQPWHLTPASSSYASIASASNLVMNFPGCMGTKGIIKEVCGVVPKDTGQFVRTSQQQCDWRQITFPSLPLASWIGMEVIMIRSVSAMRAEERQCQLLLRETPSQRRTSSLILEPKHDSGKYSICLLDWIKTDPNWGWQTFPSLPVPRSVHLTLFWTMKH